MSNEIIPVVVNVGAVSNASRLLFQVDPANGAITVVDWKAWGGGSTNSSLILTEGTVSSGGTFTATGTVSAAALGGTAAPFAAGVVKDGAADAASAVVAAGHWLAVAEGNVAACNAVTLVQVSYAVGK